MLQEKKRRNNVADHFNELRIVIPNVRQNLSRIKTIHIAQDYIVSKKETIAIKEKKIASVTSDNEELLEQSKYFVKGALLYFVYYQDINTRYLINIIHKFLKLKNKFISTFLFS